MLDIALLIGNETGLEGTDRDLQATETLCRRLGVSQVRVLRRPDRGALDDAVRWLAVGLRGGRGLLHYSGHDDPALLTRIEHLLDGLAPARDLTVLLDCCRNAGESTLGRFGRDRVLHATSDGQTSEERCFEGGWQGAFTWALSRVVEQWEVSDGAVRITNAQLVQRAGAILQALAIPQQPVFTGPGADVAFCGAADAPVTQAPQVRRRLRQIDGSGADGLKGYEVKAWPSGDILGVWVSTEGGNPGLGYAANHEYVGFNNDQFPAGDFYLEQIDIAQVPHASTIQWSVVAPQGVFGGGQPLPTAAPGQQVWAIVENPPPNPPMPPPSGWLYASSNPGEAPQWFATVGTPTFFGPVIAFMVAPGGLPAGQNVWTLNPPW